MKHKIDTGKIILQRKIAIDENDNAGTIHDKLMKIGAEMVTETVNLLLSGKMNAVSQDEFINETTVLKPAPKIFKNDCELKFDMNVLEAHNFVRGLSPYPTAWAEVQFPLLTEKQNIKIYETAPILEKHNLVPERW